MTELEALAKDCIENHTHKLVDKPTKQDIYLEVILNDECMHCVHKECHDGYHFCNQAMKDNSFYKNKKLYKGLEVIQRPTYEELEKENQRLTNLVASYMTGEEE